MTDSRFEQINRRFRHDGQADRWSIFLCAILAACGSESVSVTPPPPRAPPPAPLIITVRVIYASPSDRPFRAEYSAGIERAVSAIREWYASELGGRTFPLETSSPEWCRMSEPHTIRSSRRRGIPTSGPLLKRPSRTAYRSRRAAIHMSGWCTRT